MRLRKAPSCCLVAALVATVTVHVVARNDVEAAERREVERQARDLGAIALQVGSRVENSLAAMHAVVAATDGNQDAFRRAAGPNLVSGLFSSVALVDVSGRRPTVAFVAGEALQLPLDGQGAEVDRLVEARTHEGLVPVGRFAGPGGSVFGFSFGTAGEASRFLVYAELNLLGIPRMILQDLGDPDRVSSLEKISLAVYADPSEQPDTLVMALAPRLPLPDDRFVQPLRVGSATWRMVIAPHARLVTGMAAAVPWVLLSLGLLASILLAGIVEVVLRRRDAIRHSERRFRLLVQHSSDFVTVIDGESIVRSVSDSVAGVLGLTPSDLVGRPIGDLVHPDDRTGLLEAQRQGPGASLFVDARFRHAEGGWRDLEITGTNLLHESAVSGIVLNARDVTERRAAEGARAELARIVESTTDLVATMATDGTITYLNRAGADLLGLSPGDLPTLHAAGLVADAALLAEALEVSEREGAWSGEGTMVRPDGRSVPVWSVVLAHRNAAGVVERFSSISRDISEQKSLENQLAHQAFHDPLTGLANRALLSDRLDHALTRAARTDQPLAVLLVDLDDFKTVNDGLGHGAGDDLLVALAERLRACVRVEDTFARLGGDEFALVLESTCEDGAVESAERLLDALTAPFQVGGKELFLTASIGIAVAGPGPAVAPDALLRDADVAMYAAKAEGKGGWRLFVTEMRTGALDRLGLGMDLRRAVERDEFVVHYQPIVDLATGRAVGCEALVRWAKQGEGLVAPLRFIPLAEETGLIVTIGRWVLMEACRQVAAWQARSGDLALLCLNVNVSGRQLRDPNLLDDVVDALRASGLEPHQLVLEVTESVLVQCGSAAIERLQQIKATGVRVAMDDFGTGYSSLSSLHNLPVDVLKIDKSFVDGIGGTTSGSSLVGTIIELGRTMELEVVAEGIERPEQVEQLNRLGCRFGQGFHYAGALEPDAAFEILRQSSAVQPPARAR